MYIRDKMKLIKIHGMSLIEAVVSTCTFSKTSKLFMYL